MSSYSSTIWKLHRPSRMLRPTSSCSIRSASSVWPASRSSRDGLAEGEVGGAAQPVEGVEMPARGLHGLERLGQLARAGDGLVADAVGSLVLGELVAHRGGRYPSVSQRQTMASVGGPSAVPQARDLRRHGIALAATLCRVGAAAPLVDLDQRGDHVAEVDQQAAVLVPGGAGAASRSRAPRRPGRSARGCPAAGPRRRASTASAVATSRCRQASRNSVPHMVACSALVASVARHAERVRDDLLQQVQRPPKVLEPCGLAAARVHPAALPGLAEQRATPRRCVRRPRAAG